MNGQVGLRAPSNAVILARVLRFAPLVVAAALVAAVLSYGLAARGPSQYQSTTIVQLNRVDLNSLFLDEALPRPDTYALVASTAALVGTERVRTAASKLLGGTPSASDLEGRVSVSPEPDSTLVEITVQDDDPEGAADAADAVAKALLDVRSKDAVAQLDGPIRQATAQLARLKSSGAGSTQVDTLQTRLDQLEALRAIADAGIWTVQPATRPATETSANPRRNAFLGGFLGFVLAGGAVVAFAYLDRRVRFVEELSELWPLASIAPVPPLNAEPDQRTAEAFGLALATLTAERAVRSFAVVSAVAQEGKSHAAAQLAEAAARAGDRVLVIEADLRRPSLATRLGLSPGPGLGEVIGGDASLGEAVQSVSISETGNPAVAYDVLVAGASNSNPQGLLSSDAFASTVTASALDYDLVIVDTPPATVAADALSVTAVVEGVVVVARLGSLPRAAYSQLRNQLQPHAGAVLGAIAIGGATAKQFEYGTRGQVPS